MGSTDTMRLKKAMGFWENKPVANRNRQRRSSGLGVLQKYSVILNLLAGREKVGIEAL